jgi:hypothetical protein
MIDPIRARRSAAMPTSRQCIAPLALANATLLRVKDALTLGKESINLTEDNVRLTVHSLKSDTAWPDEGKREFLIL